MLKQCSSLARLGSFWVLLFLLAFSSAVAQDSGKDDSAKAGKDDDKKEQPIVPKDSTTQGSVTVAGHAINYQAVAGTILVAASKDADAALGMTAQPAKETPDAPP